MKIINQSILKTIHKPNKFSHKGQNGRLLVIGGSGLFHGASLWALKTASRIVDMVFYLSIPKNQEYADYLNKQLYDFINIPFEELDNYIQEADTVLLGSGMTRDGRQVLGVRGQVLGGRGQMNIRNFHNTYEVTKYLLEKYPQKKWVLDAGALQVMDSDWLKELKQVIITPHRKEFEKLFLINSKFEARNSKKYQNPNFQNSNQLNNLTMKQLFNLVASTAQNYGCTIVLKGPTDIICDPKQCVLNKTGNEGMTKGGTGDVLAGLVAALACKNDLFTAAAAGSYICGLAGDKLYREVGTFFNASDLCDEIPRTLSRLLDS